MPRIQPLLTTSIAARGKNISQLLYLLSPEPLNGSHLTQGKIHSLSDLQGPARSARPTLTPQTSLPLVPSLFPSQPASLLLFRHSSLRAFALPVHYARDALPLDTSMADSFSSSHCSNGSFSVRPLYQVPCLKPTAPSHS